MIVSDRIFLCSSVKSENCTGIFQLVLSLPELLRSNSLADTIEIKKSPQYYQCLPFYIITYLLLLELREYN
jgi:hypothetical protein